MPGRDRDDAGRPVYGGARDRYGRPTRDVFADGPETPALPGELGEAIRLGVGLFDRGRFFEAHELFEQVWKSKRLVADERGFWRAVTQVAVGFCHVQRGNARGASSVLARAVAALEGDPRTLRGIDGPALARAARAVAGRLAERDESPIDFPCLPRRPG